MQFKLLQSLHLGQKQRKSPPDRQTQNALKLPFDPSYMTFTYLLLIWIARLVRENSLSWNIDFNCKRQNISVLVFLYLVFFYLVLLYLNPAKLPLIMWSLSCIHNFSWFNISMCCTWFLPTVVSWITFPKNVYVEALIF